MKAIAIFLLMAVAGDAAAETNLRPWDRETVGVTPVGSSTPNRPRTDTGDYGVKFSNGSPALGRRQRNMQVAAPDGHAGETAVYTCRW
jgi:hypothetical protein